MSTRIIKINRGDSFEFPIILLDKKGDKYLLTAHDALYFALMYPNQKFEDAIFIKGYTHEEQNEKTGEIILKVTPNDTRYLTPGVYYYVAKLQRGGTLEAIGDSDEPDEVRTIIERTKFIINE
jgi:hypothetical protein